MLTTEDGVASRTYVYVPDGTPIRVRRHEGDDIVAVRFGDERLVLEFAEDIVQQVVEALAAGG
jgi:hypothetical protein